MNNEHKTFIAVIISGIVGISIIVGAMVMAENKQKIKLEKFSTKDEFVKLENVIILKEGSVKNADNTTSTVINFNIRGRCGCNDYTALFSNNNFMFILKNDKIIDNNELFEKDETTTES